MMAGKKKPAGKKQEPEQEFGFFSDYGYGTGTAIVLHDPPRTLKADKPRKGGKKQK